ncbi:hypothetical protein P22_2609 [Propionispora sp. 2/2-37]|uniref:DMT family transporter n=1 Tax=Propionispora sp. 2/2-37 TaxID=1677858 RepID=UPI0006BB9825|nr:DMT family transporter [Propionispora sp. 2/2-37]CUH96519.1 hypothetical protein P22_2609 [Propionispora sp. 2/2-37]
MKSTANLVLLLTAAIWGFAFVAQQAGMEHIGPFTYNGIRFALGSVSLIPLMLYFRKRKKESAGAPYPAQSAVRIGVLAGCILFFGASFQQIGLLYTTAGKAAFITGLYTVFVPIAGIFLKQRTNVVTWLSCMLAVSGLFFLCVKENFTMSPGDLLELTGSFFWTAHIILIDRYSAKLDTLKLAGVQFATCSGLSLLTAISLETITWNGVLLAGIPILYGGLLSVGIAYTLQIIGQKYAEPAHASIILSMETVFATIGGYFFLQEVLGTRELWGCALMLSGMLLSQLRNLTSSGKSPVSQPKESC